MPQGAGLGGTLLAPQLAVKGPRTNGDPGSPVGYGPGIVLQLMGECLAEYTLGARAERSEAVFWCGRRYWSTMWLVGRGVYAFLLYARGSCGIAWGCFFIFFLARELAGPPLACGVPYLP